MSEKRKFRINSAFLTAVLSCVLTAVAVITSAVLGDYKIRQGLAPLRTLVSNRQSTAPTIASVPGPQIDRFRDRGVRIGAYQLTNAPAIAGTRRTHVTIASLDQEAWGIFDSILPDRSSSSMHGWFSGGLDEVVVSPQFAISLGLDRGASRQWPILSIGDQHLRIVGVLTRNESAMFRLAGLSADLYLLLNHSSNWLRSDIRPYHVLALPTTHITASLDGVLAESLVAFPNQSGQENAFVDILAVTVGPWRKAGMVVIGTLGLLCAIICAALWTSYRDHQLAIRSELATRRMLGASLLSIMLLCLRQSLVPAVAGMLASAFLVQIAANLTVSSWIARHLTAIPFGVDLGVVAWLKGTAILLPLIVAMSLLWALVASHLADAILRRDAGERGLGSRSALVAISTASALLLAYMAVGSQNALLQLERARLTGDPAGLIRIYLYFSMDGKELASANTLKEFRHRAQVLFEDAKGLLQPLAQKQEVSASYPDIMVQHPGTVRVRLTGPSGGQTIEAAIRSAVVAPGYFELLHLPIQSGEDCPATLESGDRRSVLVNHAFLRQSKVPIRTYSSWLIQDQSSGIWFQIRGVVADSAFGENLQAPSAMFQCDFSNGWNFYFRPRSKDAAKSVEAAMLVLSHRWPVAQLDGVAVDDELNGMLGRSKVQAVALSLFAVIALFAGLASIAFSTLFLVQSQRKAIAIREAVGASDLRLLWFLGRPLFRALGVGITAAILLCALASRVVFDFTGIALDVSMRSASLTLGAVALEFAATTVIAIASRSRLNLSEILRQD